MIILRLVFASTLEKNNENQSVRLARVHCCANLMNKIKNYAHFVLIYQQKTRQITFYKFRN